MLCVAGRMMTCAASTDKLNSSSEGRSGKPIDWAVTKKIRPLRNHKSPVMSKRIPSQLEAMAAKSEIRSVQRDSMAGRQTLFPQTIEILDIGGEGRYETAWNLNIRPQKTLGCRKGELIPNWIEGRSTAIPLADSSVRRVIMEQVPLNRKAVHEIYRVIVEGGVVELRHFYNSANHPHVWACRVIPGERTQSTISWGNQKLEETIFRSVKKSAHRPPQL